MTRFTANQGLERLILETIKKIHVHHCTTKFLHFAFVNKTICLKSGIWLQRKKRFHFLSPDKNRQFGIGGFHIEGVKTANPKKSGVRGKIPETPPTHNPPT